MNQQEMFGTAKWIECPNPAEAPIFRKIFYSKNNETADITICGLGFFELKINGQKVSNDLLVPGASNYSARDLSKFNYPLFDRLSFRTYCLKYDIGRYLKDGENVLTIMLGGGYYHQELYDAEGNVSYGRPKLCYIIRKESGNVISDSSTQSFEGYYERCNLYYGEKQNHLKKPQGFEAPDYSGTEFTLSKEIPAPETRFFIQSAPSDKIAEVITDIKLIDEYDGKKLYDCGKNTAGRVVIKCSKAGEKIRVRHAEQIMGHEYWGIHFSDEKYIDEYITDGITDEYCPHFGWQGFRYFEIEGDATPVEVQVIHSDCPVTSGFKCDNENLNWLYDTYVYTQLCNMHAGIPSDCPHRERLGYTGDGQLCCEAAMLMLDCKEFYRKWLQDISDCQDVDNGHVQHTAPLMGGGGGPCGWGGAIVEVPCKFYKIFGETEVLEEFFPKMLSFLDYLDSRSDNGLVWREEEGGWCLGDWLPPQPIKVPETYVNTCLYIKFMKQVIEIGKILNREQETKHLAQRIEKSEKSVIAAYYSRQQQAFCGDVDGASCLAMTAGFDKADVKNKIIEKYSALGQYDTGIIATLELTEWLFDIGENDLAVRLMSGEGEASFYNMKKQGATTLWENWNGHSSQNHPMFGAVARTLFTKLLGIGQSTDSAGFKEIIIKPHLCETINFAQGFITTENGKIFVRYNKENSRISFVLEVENNKHATFVFNGCKYEFTGRKEFDFSL